jgi:hypothetical protein
MHVFARALFLGCCVVAAGCAGEGDARGPGGSGGSGGSGGGGTGDGSGAGGGAEISGDISESAAWSGKVALTGNTTIRPGVEITIAAGTAVEAAMGVTLTVGGTLAVEGTAEAPVTMRPAAGAGGWGGIVAQSGASVTLAFVEATKAASVLTCSAGAALCAVRDSHFFSIGKALEISAVATVEHSRIEDMANAGIAVYDGAKLTITDSYMLTSTHDIIVQSGGDLVVDHSEVGGAQGSYEHCNFHIGGSASVKVTNTNIVASVYGLMIGGSGAAVFNNNAFVGNDPNQDVLDLGGNTNVNLRDNYWDQGAPNLAPVFDISGALQAMPEGVGPR